MSNIKKIAFASVTALGLMVCGPASAGAIITATLLDKGADMEMPKDLGFNMGGDMTKATMGIGLSRSTVAAGHVTFHVLDSSEDMVHEMIVARLKSLDEKLPYLADEEEVDEDRAGDLGDPLLQCSRTLYGRNVDYPHRDQIGAICL
jgi:uncharacterized cupredoxin-like copper-binding protein